MLEDLAMYKGDIDAGETIEGVLIFEIPETEASNVNNMVLSITVDGKSDYMQLQGGSMEMWTETVVDTEAVMDEMTPTDEGYVQETDEKSMQDAEYGYNDLAEEYMNAVEMENNSNGDSGASGGNVTVVGSNRNYEKRSVGLCTTDLFCILCRKNKAIFKMVMHIYMGRK